MISRAQKMLLLLLLVMWMWVRRMRMMLLLVVVVVVMVMVVAGVTVGVHSAANAQTLRPFSRQRPAQPCQLRACTAGINFCGGRAPQSPVRQSFA